MLLPIQPNSNLWSEFRRESGFNSTGQHQHPSNKTRRWDEFNRLNDSRLLFFLSSWWLFPTVQLLLLPSVMRSNDYKTLNFPPNYRQKLLECSRCTPSPNCPLLMLVIKHQLNIISCGISRRSDLTSRFDPAGSSHGKCPLVNWRILMLRDQSNDTKLQLHSIHHQLICISNLT